MADEEVKTADEMVSPGALAAAAAADAVKAKSFSTVGKWASEFVGKQPPPRPVLLAQSVQWVDGEAVVDPGAAWMPAGRLGLVASAGGKGKTAVLMHLAAHVAAGIDWCGLKVVKRGAVALVLGEEDEGECHRRLNDAWRSMPDGSWQRAAAQTLVLPLAGTGNNQLVAESPMARTVEASPRAEELAAYLEASAPEGGFALVVVDPFARFAGTSAETDNASATRTMEVLEKLTKLRGDPTVLVAHHTKKRGKDDAGADLVELIRGSSAIKDAARWAVLLEADAPDESGKGRAVLRIVKSNYTSTAYAVELVTRYGIPESGKVRPVRELDAEKTEMKSGGGGKAPKNPGKGSTLQAGAEAHEKRVGPRDV